MRRGCDEPIGDDELEGLFRSLAGRPLALAISGGADSMALMHLVACWAALPEVKAKWAEWWRNSLADNPDARLFPPAIDVHGLKPPNWLEAALDIDALKRAGGPPQVVVLTVDHGLRPEAAREAEWVASEAERLGFPCEVLRWQGEKPRTGIQVAAREARRALMLDVLRSEASALRIIGLGGAYRLAWNAADRVLVTAHHREDQAETFLMRLARGSGIEGLSAMRGLDTAVREPTPERPSSFAVHLLRPLLGVSKSRLVATLRAWGQAWVEDPSNTDERFERVRWRKFLAQAGDLGLTAEKIALAARRLGDAEQSLRILKNEPASASTIEVSTGLCAATAVAWLGWNEYLIARTLRQLIRWYGGGAREPELGQLEHIARLLRDERARKECVGLTLGGCKIELSGERHERLRIYREGAGANIPPVPLEPGRTLEWDGGRFSIRVEPYAEPPVRIEALGMARWARLKKELPALGVLSWPAAAAAALPVIVRGDAVVAYPAIPALLKRTAPNDEALFAAWRAFDASCEQEYQVHFRMAPDW